MLSISDIIVNNSEIKQNNVKQQHSNKKARTFTEGKLSGALVEDVRKAFASR
jgi:hypothetical protein